MKQLTHCRIALSKLIGKNSYVHMLFIDFSSAFNTILLMKPVTLNSLGLSPTLCNWILDFLANRQQRIRVGSCYSSTLSLSTGVPQGCVLSPFLLTLYTYDCRF